ncbi:pyocin knob domain-containing protein [Mesorhizobium sp. M0152]|uniref:pyocin knob domain-containing protein n=1 Tax=Mesorhizobium sp. M0152 TaxID=2956898 RepID=UPI0033354D6E
MTVTNTTANRGYQLPFEDNQLADDVLRLISALSAIDVDVAAMLVSIGQRALLIHSHVIADTTGLQAALDSKQNGSEKGNANGYAALDGTGKVPAAQLPSALFGSLSYQGTWNANTNTPTIPAASAANKGQYYKVATAGAVTVDGVNEWKVGDWIVSSGTVWDKVDNTDQVASVAGLQGAISAASLKTALAITAADIVSGTLADALLPTRLGVVAKTITDWNSALDNGWYMGTGAANAPDAGWWLGNVEAHGGGGWRTQTIHAFTTDGASNTTVMRRAMDNNAWGTWYRLQLSQAEQDARYLAIGGTAARASVANTLAAGGGTGSAMSFNWSGQGGQPTWVWGGSDGINHYVYNPSNFNVNSVGGWTQATISAQIESRAQAWSVEYTVNRSIGSIGSYAFLRRVGAFAINPGDNVAGSSLQYTNASGNANGGSPAGTWKCMGYINDTAATTTGATAVFLRVG